MVGGVAAGAVAWNDVLVSGRVEREGVEDSLGEDDSVRVDFRRACVQHAAVGTGKVQVRSAVAVFEAATVKLAQRAVLAEDRHDHATGKELGSVFAKDADLLQDRHGVGGKDLVQGAVAVADLERFERFRIGDVTAFEIVDCRGVRTAQGPVIVVEHVGNGLRLVG